jgi:hypothetical protein
LGESFVKEISAVIRHLSDFIRVKCFFRIKETFRTPTGKRFGPEFIDQGTTIGNAIYDKMSEMLQSGR